MAKVRQTAAHVPALNTAEMESNMKLLYSRLTLVLAFNSVRVEHFWKLAIGITNRHRPH